MNELVRYIETHDPFTHDLPSPAHRLTVAETVGIIVVCLLTVAAGLAWGLYLGNVL